MFCLNMFAIQGGNIRGEKPKRVDSRYCCEACRKAHWDAKRRFKEYGSYLPVEYYAPIYTETVNDNANLYEMASEAETLGDRLNERVVTSPVSKKDVRERIKARKPGEIITYQSMKQAKKAEEKREKTDIIAVYRQIIRRTNPYIIERARDALKFLTT